MRDRSVGAFERLLDEASLDGQQMLAQVEALIRQDRERVRAEGSDGRGRLIDVRSECPGLEDFQRVLLIQSVCRSLDGDRLRRVFERSHAQRAVERLDFERPINRWSIFRWQIGHLDDTPRAHDGESLYEVRKLADISRPRAKRQSAERAG